MSKKYYFVLTPYENEDELISKAANYYGSKDYAPASDNPDFVDAMKKTLTDPNTSFNVNLMLIGISAMAMSFCDSVYVSKDWEKDDCCKFCHALAFSHGLDIVYES